LANYGFVPVLKKVTATAMTKIKIDGITRKQTPHKSSKFRLFWTEKKVKVIVKQCPGKTINLQFLQQLRETAQKESSICIVKENIPLFYPSNDNVLQQPS
jgi:hypothetical protein